MADGYGSPYTGALAGINSTVHSYLPWLMLGQRKDNTAEQAASAQAIESLQKSADSGSFNAYRPAESFSQNPAAINPAVNSPVGQGGYIPPGEQINRLTPQGELAMKIGGQATVDSLQKMSDLKKEEINMTLNEKKIKGMSATADEVEKRIQKISSTDTKNWTKEATDFYLNSNLKVVSELSKQSQVPVDKSMLTDLKKYQDSRRTKVMDSLTALHTELGTAKGLTAQNIGMYNGLVSEAMKLGIFDKETAKPHEEFGKQAMQKLFTEKDERPYKVGQQIEIKRGREIETHRVTGYDERGQPVTEKIATAEKDKPASVTIQENKDREYLKYLESTSYKEALDRTRLKYKSGLTITNTPEGPQVQFGGTGGTDAEAYFMKTKDEIYQKRVESAVKKNLLPEKYRLSTEEAKPAAETAPAPMDVFTEAVEAIKFNDTKKKDVRAEVVLRLRKAGYSDADIKKNPQLYALLKDNLLQD
jgi:hypothetical protein